MKACNILTLDIDIGYTNWELTMWNLTFTSGLLTANTSPKLSLAGSSV